MVAGAEQAGVFVQTMLPQLFLLHLSLSFCASFLDEYESLKRSALSQLNRMWEQAPPALHHAEPGFDAENVKLNYLHAIELLRDIVNQPDLQFGLGSKQAENAIEILAELRVEYTNVVSFLVQYPPLAVSPTLKAQMVKNQLKFSPELYCPVLIQVHRKDSSLFELIAKESTELGLGCFHHLPVFPSPSFWIPGKFVDEELILAEAIIFTLLAPSVNNERVEVSVAYFNQISLSGFEYFDKKSLSSMVGTLDLILWSKKAHPEWNELGLKEITTLVMEMNACPKIRLHHWIGLVHILANYATPEVRLALPNLLEDLQNDPNHAELLEKLAFAYTLDMKYLAGWDEQKLGQFFGDFSLVAPLEVANRLAGSRTSEAIVETMGILAKKSGAWILNNDCHQFTRMIRSGDLSLSRDGSFNKAMENLSQIPNLYYLMARMLSKSQLSGYLGRRNLTKVILFRIALGLYSSMEAAMADLSPGADEGTRSLVTEAWNNFNLNPFLLLTSKKFKHLLESGAYDYEDEVNRLALSLVFHWKENPQ